MSKLNLTDKANHFSIGGNKMKFIKVNLIIMFIAGVSLSGVWADDTGWKKIGESKGIVGYTRPTSKSSVEEIKGVGIIEAPVAVIEALLRDTRAGLNTCTSARRPRKSIPRSSRTPRIPSISIMSPP